MTDSDLPHPDVLRAVVHGIDDSDAVEIEVQGCVSSVFGVSATCGEKTYSSGATGSLTSGTGFTGDTAIPVALTAFADTTFEFVQGYPVLIVRLPTNEDTRVTGYSICGEDKDICDDFLFPAGPPNI
jgi:hypothetical protein